MFVITAFDVVPQIIMDSINPDIILANCLIKCHLVLHVDGSGSEILIRILLRAPPTVPMLFGSLGRSIPRIISA